jgi:hypothetical protein
MSLQLLSRWTCDGCGAKAEAGVCTAPPAGWFWWIPSIGVTCHRCPQCEARWRATDPQNASKVYGHRVSA